MKQLFKGFYSSTEEEIKRLWKECIFVFDSNVLLDFYRHDESTTEDLFSILDKIKERRWLPYLSALEFHKHRLSVIADERKKFDDAKEQLGRARKILYKTTKESSDNLFELFDENLKKMEFKLPIINDRDKILERVESLFLGKIGSPFSKSEVEEIYKEGKERFSGKIPPGYEDNKKSCKFSYGGIIYDTRYSDLVIWKEIIKKAKDPKNKGIIFITNDLKKDWWEIIKQGKKRIRPRPELIDEISREGGVNTFYMYDSGEFITAANKYLKGINSSPDSLKQVVDTLQNQHTSYFMRRYPYQRKVRNAYHGTSENLKEKFKDLMEEWFFENFEDPVNNCPYASTEGGYQYIYGGPYDARDVLVDEFLGIYDEDLINEVADKIGEDCCEWSGIPSGDYDL